MSAAWPPPCEWPVTMTLGQRTVSPSRKASQPPAGSSVTSMRSARTRRGSMPSVSFSPATSDALPGATTPVTSVVRVGRKQASSPKQRFASAWRFRYESAITW